MLNPSAATELPPNYPAQDYGRLFDHTTAAGVGVIGIRVLAGGALSGSTARDPIASPPPEPIGSAMSYEADVVRARRLLPLVKEGFAASLTEAAYAVCNLAFSDRDHLDRRGNATTVRGCARCCSKGSIAIRSARSPVRTATELCRRTTVIAAA